MSEIIKLSKGALARHEAGHAVLHVAYERTLTLIEIDPEKNSGRVEFHPSMEDLESRAAADFAGPLSQILQYEDSVGQYLPKCLKSIIFEQTIPTKIPEQYHALNWGYDILCAFQVPLSIRDELKNLERKLKTYLQRETILTALNNVENLLLDDHKPNPREAQKIIEAALSEDDKNPEFSIILRGYVLK